MRSNLDNGHRRALVVRRRGTDAPRAEVGRGRCLAAGVVELVRLAELAEVMLVLWSFMVRFYRCYFVVEIIEV